MLKAPHFFYELKDNVYKSPLNIMAGPFKKLKTLLVRRALKYRAYINKAPNFKDILIEITSPGYFKSKISQLCNGLRLNLWIIIGDEISSRQRLVIMYAGHELGKNYLIKLAFSSSYSENYIGKKWLWKIPKIAKKSNHKCSLMVIEVFNSFRILFKSMKCFYIPFWIYGETDISVDNSLFSKSESLKSDIRRIKRNKYHFKLTDEPSQLHNFYYNMYTPYITKVHGNRSDVWSYDNVKRELRKHGELLLIKKGKDYIAGILLRRKKNNRAKLSLIGVKDGNFDYVRDGVIGALVYFSVSYLAEKGFTMFEHGGSRPFLKDGVLQYKKKWKQKICGRAKSGFLIKIRSKTNGAKGFFLNNPFIYEDKTELSGAIFVANDHPFFREDFVKTYKDYHIEGLSKLEIYQFEEAGSRMWSIIQSSLTE